MELKFYQIDAFTNERFGGNPAAVVLDADKLNNNQMQVIAREMALSETAFVINSNSSEYDFQIRFFTPTDEVELCGHATIATYYLLGRLGKIKSSKGKAVVKQKALAGILPVEIYFKDNDVSKVMMTQAKPQYIFTADDLNEMSEIMGIDREDIGLEGFNVLPKAYSTGLPDIILPVKDMDVVKKIKPDFAKLTEYSRRKKVVGVHAFTMKNTKENIVVCRNFAPAYGINEEAATGTSNGALAAYLLDNNIIDLHDRIELVCKQGYFMNRPSQIHVIIERKSSDLEIKVGGKAVIVMEGKLYL